ncbi:CHAT domain-containing protein, partial [Fulvivirga sp. RKSG066]|uniref:CHAT domain-containing protein n=1 Tax=Fulvivirga aurantia TaxID=2529383 RepID=UPI0012BBB4CD
LFCHYTGDAQIGKFLKERTKDLNNKGNLAGLKEKLGGAMSKKLNDERAQMDSTSFSYAISVNDNADFVETDGAKEDFIKWGSNLMNQGDADEKESARAMVDLGELWYAKGYYKRAGDIFNAAKLKYEINNLTNEANYYKLIANIGLLYGTMGRYNLAEETTREALALRKEAYGEDHPSYGASLNNLAVLKKETGQYNDSEKLISESINILKSHEDSKEMPLAIALNNRAMLYQAMGRYDEAGKELTAAISISEEHQGKKSGNHQKFLTNMALLKQEMGDYNKAEELFLDLIAIKKRRMGSNSPDYAHMQSNLAALYMEKGEYEKVEERLKTAIEIYKNKYGESHRQYASAISDLGNFYRFQSQYEEARPLIQQAYYIRKKQLGEEHPEYVQSIEDRAILEWKTGNAEKATEFYHTALEKSLAFINSYFPPMSEAEKTSYWDKLRPRFERFYAFVIDVRNEQPQLLTDMFNYHVATKGLLLNTTNKIKEEILESDDQDLIKQYLQWLDQKETLARYYSYSIEELEEQQINLDSMERAANDNERFLSEKSSVFKEGYKIVEVTYDDVNAALGNGDVAVEVIRVRKFDNILTDDSQYVALIAQKSANKPLSVVLTNGKELETRYYQYYNNAVHQKIQDDYSYGQYWAPIATEVAGSSNIYLSLDGIYNQINLNTLRTPSGSFVIDQYNLAFIGNSKELTSSSGNTSNSKEAFLIGNPDYGNSEIAQLPGTKKEIESISQLLAKRGFKLAKHTEAQATEGNLKSIDNPKVLHVATHGYFLEDKHLNKEKVFGVSTESARDNPLLRAGILLTGAQNAQSGSNSLESSNNGVLTAYEAMNLSLQQTDLVVLSACETGVGDVKAGEGVYGLQRAFFAAGANTLIMSLWKVDDAATQELMTNFYDNWSRYGNKKEAFKKAQLALKSKHQDPYYWGAFIMIGS